MTSKTKGSPLVHYASPDELNSSEILAVVEPVSMTLVEPFAVWLDDELAELEHRFRSFRTRRSSATGLGR